VLVVYNVVGIRRAGFLTYFKDVMFIPGVPKFVYPILAPIELLTILFIRPFTLTLRLFANMFAGHMLLLVFILGADYMIFEIANPALKAAGVLTGLFAVLFTFFELFVQVFQAYIFALLTALYISGAVNEGH
jgi:F-type H+-transporting ATPase subunit a